VAGKIENFVERVGGQRDAAGAADIDRFLPGGKENRTQVGIVAQLADRLARQRHDAGVAGEQDELHPQLGQDLLAQGRIKTGLQAKREKILSSLAALAVELTEYHAHEGADLLYPAGGDDRRADLRHAAHHGVGPQGSGSAARRRRCRSAAG